MHEVKKKKKKKGTNVDTDAAFSSIQTARKEPNSMVPHLVLPLGLGSEGHHATLPKLSNCRLSYPY